MDSIDSAKAIKAHRVRKRFLNSSACFSIVAWVLCVALSGCAHVAADAPATAGASAGGGSQPPAAGSATPASAAQAGAAQPAGASTPPASTAAFAVSPELMRQARALGYSPEKMRDGTTVFCRQEVTVGTRFAKKQCVTQQDIPSMVQNSQEQQDQLRANCGGQGCGGPTSH